MATKVNLDAMIPRADFSASSDDGGAAEKIGSFGLEQLKPTSFLVSQLRKPDFQRETNHWSADQLVTFLKSYLDNELVPSAILWRSPSYVFVIDGGHRISALRAWLTDDYGDGAISHKFYKGTIPADQKRMAKRVRSKIEAEIGSFTKLVDAMHNPDEYNDDLLKKRARNAVTRSLSLQWVEGDAEKAETSFFKINTQGTPLHKTEERLLRERKNPIAIAARSIVRAGTGHKYWSRFEPEAKSEIEASAVELHHLLFQPEINEPIKTLDLPLGGRASPINALNLLMDFIELAAGENGKEKADWFINQQDKDGSGTVETLKRSTKLMRRLTGNDAASVGLHPAVYFYNHRGKHSEPLFLGVTKAFAEATRNNNRQFFKDFTLARERLENFLIKNKPIINQAIVQIGSGNRVERLAAMFRELIKRFKNEEKVSTDDLLAILQLQGKLVASEMESAAGQNFDRETRSEIYLRQSLDAAIICPICNGRIDSNKSVSFDHIQRKSEGGLGVASNGQITHPYCNSGIKN